MIVQEPLSSEGRPRRRRGSAIQCSGADYYRKSCSVSLVIWKAPEVVEFNTVSCVLHKKV